MFVEYFLCREFQCEHEIVCPSEGEISTRLPSRNTDQQSV